MAAKKRTGKAAEKHGLSKTAEYRVWWRMINRCTNPKHEKWKYWGGRGIKVCERWAQSFLAFLEDMGQCPPKHSLDRFPDQNGNYEKGNCRWATQKQQMRNQRGNKLITINGETKCLAEWAEQYGIDQDVAQARMANLGWEPEKAFTTPVNNKPHILLTLDGRTQTAEEWGREVGITGGAICHRINKGWSAEEAIKTPAKETERLLTLNGVTLNINGWAERTGIDARIIQNRIAALGWSIEKSLTEPTRPSVKLLEYGGKTQSLKDWSKELELELDYHVLVCRITTYGWSVQKAFETPIRKRTCSRQMPSQASQD